MQTGIIMQIGITITMQVMVITQLVLKLIVL